MPRVQPNDCLIALVLPIPCATIKMLGHCDMLPSAFGLLTPSQEKQVRVHAASGFLPQLQRVLDGLNPPNVVRFPTNLGCLKTATEL